jgi:hypothetical protein
MSQPSTLRFTPNQQDYGTVLRNSFWLQADVKVSIMILAGAFGFVIYLVLAKSSPISFYELIWLWVPPVLATNIFLIQPSRLMRRAAQSK